VSVAAPQGRNISDETVFLLQRSPPETNRWSDTTVEQRGTAMWDIIINLIYQRSCENYFAAAETLARHA
jgi:hypothetical protein